MRLEVAWHPSWGERPLARPRSPRRDVAAAVPRLPMTPAQQALRCACLMFGVTRAELRGPSRRRGIVMARRYFIWRAAKQIGLSLPQIGALLNRDHTTVLHHLQAMERHG